MKMVNTTCNSTEDMVDKLQSLKGKTKLKFYKNISNYYDEKKNKNFQNREDTFSRNAQGICKNYLEVLLLMKVLQTKPQDKNVNISYFNLCYTVIKTRKEKEQKEIVVDENENNDYINFIDSITPNHYIRIKPRETILR